MHRWKLFNSSLEEISAFPFENFLQTHQKRTFLITTTRPSKMIYQQKSKCLFGLISNNQFLKKNCSITVHRMVCHGASFINYFEYPLGFLFESSIEARIKTNKSAQVGHAHITSFIKNTWDTAK